MQDFKVEQDENGFFDLVIDSENKDFESVDGFETAIDFQLFIDKRVSKNEVSKARRRQGWMGDLLTKQEGYEVGSLIYLKNQSRNTQQDKNEIAAYAENAMEYFISIKAVKDANAIVVGDNIEGELKIDLDEVARFTRLWRNTITF